MRGGFPKKYPLEFDGKIPVAEEWVIFSGIFGEKFGVQAAAVLDFLVAMEARGAQDSRGFSPRVRGFWREKFFVDFRGFENSVEEFRAFARVVGKFSPMKLRGVVDPEFRDFFAQFWPQISEYFVETTTLAWWNFGEKSVVSPLAVQREIQRREIFEIRYYLDSKNHSFVVPVEQLVTIFGDVAIAVHPLDKRYKKFIGKNAVVPVINRVIPVIGDPAVDVTVGVQRVCPAHDVWSRQCAQRNNLPVLPAFDAENRLTEQSGGEFAGREFSEVEENILVVLEEIHNLVAREEREVPVVVDKPGRAPLCPVLRSGDFLPVEVAEDADRAKLLVGQDAAKFRVPKFVKKNQGIRVVASPVAENFWGFFVKFLLGKNLIGEKFRIDDVFEIAFSKLAGEIFFLDFCRRCADSRWAGEAAAWFAKVSPLFSALSLEISEAVLDEIQVELEAEFAWDEESQIFSVETSRVDPLWADAFKFLSVEDAQKFVAFGQDFRGRGARDLAQIVAENLGVGNFENFQKVSRNGEIQEQSAKSFAREISEIPADLLRVGLLPADFLAEMEWVRVFDKIRNAARFVFLHHAAGGSASAIAQHLSENLEKVPPLGQQLIAHFAEFREELEQVAEPAEFVEKIWEFFSDFADLYLEIGKLEKSEILSAVFVRVLVELLDEIAVLLPNAVAALRRIFGGAEPVEIAASKDYKIQFLIEVLRDLVEEKSRAGWRKHQKVELCVAANESVRASLLEKSQVFAEILKVEEIHGEMGTDFLKIEKAGVELGIRPVAMVDVAGESRADLEAELAEKRQRISDLKSLILSGVANRAVLEEEIESLSEEVEALEHALL